MIRCWGSGGGLRAAVDRAKDRRILVHPVNGEVPPVKGRPRKLPHYANRGKTSSSGGELASARSCFSTVRTALGKLRIAGLLAQFDVARSFPQFPRPLLLQPTILTSERGTRFGIRKPPNHVPPPHLPDDPEYFGLETEPTAPARSDLYEAVYAYDNLTASPFFADSRQAWQIATAARPSSPPTVGERPSNRPLTNS